MARQYRVLAVSSIGNVLTVAMADPLNIFAIDDLKVFTGYEIDPVIASEREIIKIIGDSTQESGNVQEIADTVEEGKDGVEILKEEQLINIKDDTLQDSQKSPIVKILSLKEAVAKLKGTGHERSILVVSRPTDLVFLIENGVSIKEVSVGWMSSCPGKRRIFETVSVDEEDIEAFRELISKGVNVKYQASPSDVQLDMAGYII